MSVRDSVYIDILTDVKQSVAGVASLAAGIGAAVVAFQKIKKVVDESIKAYGVQELAVRKLENAIKITGKASTISTSEMVKLAKALQGVTTYGDEVTVSAMAMLQQLSNLSNTGLKQVVPLVQDFASAMGIDLETAATLVGKTLGSSTNALSRYGLEVDMTGTKEEKLANLTQAMREKFGGMAEAIGDTATGSMIKLENAVSDLQESFGELVVMAIRPAVEQTATLVSEMVELLDTFNLYNSAYAKSKSTSGVLSMSSEEQIATLEMELAATKRKKMAVGIISMGKDEGKRQEMATYYTQLEAFYAKQIAALKAGGKEIKYQDEDTARIEYTQGKLAETEEKRLALSQLISAEYETGSSYLYDQLKISEKLQRTIDQVSGLRSQAKAMNVPFPEELQQYINSLVAERDAALAKERGGFIPNMKGKMPTADMFGGMKGSGISAFEKFFGGGQGEKFGDYAREGMEGVTDAIGEASDAMKPLNDETLKLYQTYASIASIAGETFGSLLKGGDAAEAMKKMIKDVAATVLTSLGTTAMALVAAGDVAALPAALAAFAAAGTIKALGEGGIVSKPTMALIGEKGPEAVIPLGRGGMGSTHYHTHIHAGSVIAERGLRSIVAGGRRGA